MTTTLTAPPARAGRYRLHYTATLTGPLHHGTGTAGNTSRLRTQPITLPDAASVSTPFVSGNSVRSRLRKALAWHLIHTLDLAEGDLSKAQADLLFSGGAITRTGSDTDLEQARRVERLMPPLALFGYSAGSSMTRGTFDVNFLHLVCAQNAWRLTPAQAGLPQAGRAASVFRGVEFGTRVDVSGSAVDRYLDLTVDAPTTTQMIYDLEVLQPGAVLAGSVDTRAETTREQVAVLLVALDEHMPIHAGQRGTQLAAKGAVGFGQALVDVDLAELGEVAGCRAWWEEHLPTHRAEILDLLAEIVC